MPRYPPNNNQTEISLSECSGFSSQYDFESDWHYIEGFFYVLLITNFGIVIKPLVHLAKLLTGEKGTPWQLSFSLHFANSINWSQSLYNQMFIFNNCLVTKIDMRIFYNFIMILFAVYAGLIIIVAPYGIAYCRVKNISEFPQESYFIIAFSYVIFSIMIISAFIYLTAKFNALLPMETNLVCLTVIESVTNACDFATKFI